MHTKPKCIADYNKGKSSMDISDQMATYGTALRRCTKWYRKLAFEIIWGTSVVNAHFLYNEYSLQKKLTITEFREQVIDALLERISSTNVDRPSRSRPDDKHYLVQNIVNDKKVRGCYKIYGRTGVAGKK
ncbi:unnamed protein product [Parnassius apollo]|uniref:(apollo) hypothetical protein n=1 Tax=Parnassius apollo TaxID=110799 RepID=A0A8S3W864_PARAO|nr:unnamed protein product [Parnassius apollo]